MKVLMKPIEVLARFENGTPHLIRFRLDNKEVKIEQVVSMIEEKSDVRVRSGGAKAV